MTEPGGDGEPHSLALERLVGAPDPAKLVADKAKAISHIAPAASP